MKINQIGLSRLRNDTHFQFHTEFKDLAQKHNPQALKIKPQYDAYLPIYDKVDLALKKINKSAITEKIQNADKARDEIWGDLVETNTAALRHFDPEVRESAKQLKIVFDTYGNIAKKPLNDQTSATYNIVQDLEGKYAPDVAKVGLGPWLAELKARNIAFSDLMRERFDESSLRVDIVLKKARLQLDEAYYAITELVNALVLVEGAGDYEGFIKKLNPIISKYLTALAMQAGRVSKKRGKGKNSTTGGSHEQG
jgi:hypothetical protein